MFRAWVPLRWYTALLLPPALVLTVLLLLERFVSPVYAPNHFFVGLLFGIPAGFLEEIGWMGYAFPKRRSESSGLVPSILLGAAVGLLAPACDQLSWHRDTTWCILARNTGIAVRPTPLKCIVILYIYSGTVWQSEHSNQLTSPQWDFCLGLSYFCQSQSGVISVLRRSWAQLLLRNSKRGHLCLALLLASRTAANAKWWAVQGSNLRPPACKAGALTN
jgi:hypothetical protein